MVLLIAGVVGLLLWQVQRQQPTVPLHVLTAAPTPPGSLLYREIAGNSTGFANARDMALDRTGNLYVVGDMAVVCIDPQGKRTLAANLSAAPRCIALADSGFSVGMADHIELFDRQWARQAAWPSLGPRACLTALAYGADGRLWAADAGNREIVGFDRSGAVVIRLGHADAARHIPGLVVPSAHLAVRVAGDGTLLVTNPGLRQVEYYHPTGELLRSWGQSSNENAGFAGCCNPTNIALLPDGRVVTSEKSIPRVKLYAADGRYLGLVAPPESFHASAAGLALAVTGDGRILVLDPMRNMVRVFAPKTVLK